jgi:hypothetical protein
MDGVTLFFARFAVKINVQFNLIPKLRDLKMDIVLLCALCVFFARFEVNNL